MPGPIFLKFSHYIMAITDFIDNLIILHCLLNLKLHRIYFSFAILGSYILGWRSSKYICCEDTVFYPKHLVDSYLYADVLRVFCYFALLCLRSQAFKRQRVDGVQERRELLFLRTVESEPLETWAKPQSQGHDHVIAIRTPHRVPLLGLWAFVRCA